MNETKQKQSQPHDLEYRKHGVVQILHIQKTPKINFTNNVCNINSTKSPNDRLLAALTKCHLW